MYTGEAEIQARRRILAVLLDESRRVLDAARELANMNTALVAKDEGAASKALENLHLAISDVEAFRRSLSRQLAEIGSMMMNREDLLRAAYTIETIASYLESISFRVSQLKMQVLKKAGMTEDLATLLDQIIDILGKTHETVRALHFNPAKLNELIQSVEKAERVMDEKYRSSTIKTMKELDDLKELILLKDVLERIETVSDLALSLADLVVIISLGI
ncbi:MAG: DUF47 family protein [Nitrososphaerota archaeon]|nr:DUF47 family protein [Nitrososphaerota archaeon]